MSGQFTGQIPNQAGNQMHGLPQQNGNSSHTQVQNFGQSNQVVMDTEVLRIRLFMRDKIYETLMLRQSQPNEAISRRCQDITKRLEEGLFKSAKTKEEYMNMDTLEARLQAVVKRPTPTNHTPQHSQFVNAAIPGATMMPTPGMQHHGNSNVTVSSAFDPTMLRAGTGGSMSSTTPSTGSLMPTVNGFYSGSLSNDYQQSASSFSMNSGGNNLISGQRPMSQMMPTPGFSGSNNQMTNNVENSNSNGGLSSADSLMVSQQMPQRQVVGQNSRMLQNLSGGMRSLLQQRFQNGTLNNGFGNNVPTVNGLGSSDGYLATSSLGASLRPPSQLHEPLQQPAVQGESSVSGNFYNTGASVDSLMTNHGANQVRTSSTPRASSLMNSQMNSQPSQSYMRPQLAEQVEDANWQSSLSATGNHSQPSTRQYQQQLHQMPQQEQLTVHSQQRQPIGLSQTSVRNEAFQSQHLGTRVKSENGMEHQNEVFQPQGSSGQIQVPEMQNQLQYNSNSDLPRNPPLSSLPSSHQDMRSTLMQTPQPMMIDEGTNEFGAQTYGMESDPLFSNDWHSVTDRTSLAENLSHEHVQEEFCQRIVVHDDAQCINLSSEVSSNGQPVAPESIVDQPGLGCGDSSLNAHRDRNFRNQLRWLLFLRHARWCRAPAGQCPESHCIMAQKLLKHLDGCKDITCSYPRCAHTRRLLTHQTNCRDINCPVCIPFKKFIYAQKKLRTHQDSDGLKPSVQRPNQSHEAGEAKPRETIKPSETAAVSPENLLSVKQLKSELPSQSFTPENESIFAALKVNGSSHASQSVQSFEYEKNDNYSQTKFEYPYLKAENSSDVHHNHNVTEIKNTTVEMASSHRFDGGSDMNKMSSLPKNETITPEKCNSLVKSEEAEEMVQPSEQGVGTKSGKPKIKAVSLIELFTPEQVREHITGLRQWVGQSKAKAEKNQAMDQTMSENSCQLCAVEKLAFEPPPIYCTPCGARIKRNATYYTAGAGDTRHFFCIPCYNEARGDKIFVDGTAITKGRMEKKKNDEETEEWWVQCDKCEAWQHQICALFNGRRNDGGQAEYTCPNCYMLEVERGERQPLPQSVVLGAKDLPTTVLSDHIERRLFKRLKQERLERAKSQGKSYDEVPGADGIVVRVVSSVDKKLEVKPRFLEIFREENFPMEFPYKSKVVLLFQKIEGVEVCLYGMYVQEFGSECLPPNQRRVYLSYLDSVKYFRPEIKTVNGEALRTFVYHEILIGYLEYCKKRGFASCYIWACPPLKGEDYILYCHPEIQKTPRSDKLREWYLVMLRKAIRENIVVSLTNLYDHFFIQTGESKAKVTAARLPYFDGDYWPGAAEDMINQIIQEEEGQKLNKKGPMKKTITKRALKASGQLDLSSNASKDILLMHKLGETISPMKEDFIMVHLQHSCAHCCVLMISGNRWVCELCRNFELCDRCYEEEEKRDDRERHKHGLKKIEITDVPEDTKDKDEILESEFFDTRQAFLSLCQGNHYQYDTLRRAKHSSMMVLYHLHNPTAPAFVTPCSVCHLDIEAGQGWRCETCPDYDVCNACYQKDGGVDHPHKLTNNPSIADRDAQNKEARQLRVVQLRKMLELLVHASHCRSTACQYPNCRKVKGLFRHGIQCRIRAAKGCVLCKRMWYLLQLHARACKESQCRVPRCRDLKEHLRRLQQQSDSRRRAAVMEMMRQRAKEVADNS